MTIKYEIPRSLLIKIEKVHSQLAGFIADQHVAREEMSERWLESDRADEHEGWLMGLSEWADVLQDVDEVTSANI